MFFLGHGVYAQNCNKFYLLSNCIYQVQATTDEVAIQLWAWIAHL